MKKSLKKSKVHSTNNENDGVDYFNFVFTLYHYNKALRKARPYKATRSTQREEQKVQENMHHKVIPRVMSKSIKLQLPCLIQKTCSVNKFFLEGRQLT